MSPLQKLFIAAGVTLTLLGLFWPTLAKIPLGRLPGDIIIRRENFVFYFPLTTMILVSIVFTLIIRNFRK